MLGSAQILKQLNDLDKPGRAGAAAALERAGRSGWANTSDLTPNQRALVQSIAATPPKATAVYSHPAETAAYEGSRRSVPLSGAQVTWLSRLPTDPSKIPYADAQDVFRLMASTDTDDPAQRADLPLIRSVADPLRAFHDRGAADAELAAAAVPPTPIPHTALGALADSIAAENDQLRPEEAVVRASDAINEVAQRRLRDHGVRLSAAQQRIADIEKAATDRAAVTR